MIVYCLKERTLGVFKGKVKDAGCHLIQTELEFMWKVDPEGGIRELKRGPGTYMTKMKSPKVIWDYCLDLEAYTRSNTVLDILSWTV